MPEKELVEHIKKSKMKGIVNEDGEIKEMLQHDNEEKKDWDKRDPVELMRKLKPL